MRMWHGIRPHRLAALLFLVLWVCAWAVTIITWERDAAGYSVGMNPVAIPLHFVLPLVLGILVGLPRRGGGHGSWKACALAGSVFGVVEFGVLWLVEGLWLPAAASEAPLSELAVGAIVGAVIYAAVCAVLAVVGGKVGRALGRRGSDV